MTQIGGPLMHFMPVIAGARHRESTLIDPFINYVSFQTEFHGRVTGNREPATDFQTIPKDLALNHPLFVAGMPRRYPLSGENSHEPPPLGISEYGAYYAAEHPEFGFSPQGCGVVVLDCSDLNLDGHDFTMSIKVSAKNTEKNRAQTIAGRWGTGSNTRSWILEYYLVYGLIQFRYATNSDDRIAPQDNMPYFRLGRLSAGIYTEDDGITADEFFNDTWHEIVVSRQGDLMNISIDGIPGHRGADFSENPTDEIFSLPAFENLLAIGAVTASQTGPRVSSANWRGMINTFYLEIDGQPKLDVRFNEYWSLWWIGHYPVEKYPRTTPMLTEALQDQNGLIKQSPYVGISWPYDVTIDFEDKDFTIEVFALRFSHVYQHPQHIFGRGWATAGNRVWRLYVYDDPAAPAYPFSNPLNHQGKLVFQWSYDGTTVHEITLKSGIVQNQIYTIDFAASRFEGMLRLYINGTKVGEDDNGGAAHYAGTDLSMAFYSNSVSGQETALTITGIQGVRLTKDKARYRGNSYRVPPLPLPRTSE